MGIFPIRREIYEVVRHQPARLDSEGFDAMPSLLEHLDDPFEILPSVENIVAGRDRRFIRGKVEFGGVASKAPNLRRLFDRLDDEVEAAL
jgi:hypothetical protein